MKRSKNSQGVTLIELLVGMGVLALLAVLAMGSSQKIRENGWRSACLSNMHQVGLGLLLYANENEGQLPGRFTGVDPGTGLAYDKWPKILSTYLQDHRALIDPSDPTARNLAIDTLLSNSGNKTSFFFNGFNDLGAYVDPSLQVRLQQLDAPGQIILLGQKNHGSTQYYMDFVEPPHGNQNDVLNKTAFAGGSNYVFADGSARFLKLSQYEDKFWLVNQDYPIPAMP